MIQENNMESGYQENQRKIEKIKQRTIQSMDVFIVDIDKTGVYKEDSLVKQEINKGLMEIIELDTENVECGSMIKEVVNIMERMAENKADLDKRIYLYLIKAELLKQ